MVPSWLSDQIATKAPILDFETERFNNSESPCHSAVSHQVLAQSDCLGDMIYRFSRWLPWWPSWISERNHFSNSKSPCCPDAFHQVSTPSDTVREEITIEDFQDGGHYCLC